nr:MAG TPA: zinc-ribbon domain protein [Caudoviricetes sp.]DAU04534.1 MAG TPA: zinc-ribbon domain protein [Caudoviricetes sp.]
MNIMNCTCEYCGQLHHIPGCPNYREPFSAYKCEFCGSSIYDGEKYIGKYLNVGVNKYVHYECAMDNPEWLIKFLGVDIETMRDCEY